MKGLHVPFILYPTQCSNNVPNPTALPSAICLKVRERLKSPKGPDTQGWHRSLRPCKTAVIETVHSSTPTDLTGLRFLG